MKGTDHEFRQYVALSSLLLLRPSQALTPLDALSPNTLNVWISNNVTDQVSHPHKEHKIAVVFTNFNL
jgi:hypothetical protein